MARLSRLLRFSGLLLFIAFIILYNLISKREYRKIIELKQELRNEKYNINNELNTKNEHIQIIYKEPEIKYERANATFMTLARNEDLPALRETIRNYEDRFNKKFNYPWIFINDKEFTPEFKKQISNIVSGEVQFEIIPKKYWELPGNIDKDLAKQNRIKSRTKMMYGESETYRFMCRFFSGLFYQMEVMKKYQYVWRVEPETKLYCDVNYDVFKFMKENDKTYGFTVTLREFPQTIPTLWDHVLKFIELYPGYLNENNFLDFISEDRGGHYSLCHFWSNFEIVNMDFYRSEAYSAFFNYLDLQKGFFYERWGDAPIHSIAVSLFLDKSQIHFFNDIGYYHSPMSNCPIDDDIWSKNNCACDQNTDITFRDYSCTNIYHDLKGLEKPKGWEKHTGNGQYFE